MVRVIGLLVLVAAVAASAAFASPVPDDVTSALAATGLQIADATDLAPASLSVSPRRARRVALKTFGEMAMPYRSDWRRVGRVTIHLVRIVRSGSSALIPGDAAWMVLIRDVTLPVFGPPGRPGPPFTIGMLAVFVRTDRPQYLEAVGF